MTQRFELKEPSELPTQTDPPPLPDQATNKALKTTSKKEESSETARQKWGNKAELLLSCISLTIGFGNIWRFPFVALENGGGAFLFPYLLVLLFIGRPTYYMEFCMGQFSSCGPIQVWELLPAFKGTFTQGYHYSLHFYYYYFFILLAYTHTEHTYLRRLVLGAFYFGTAASYI